MFYRYGSIKKTLSTRSLMQFFALYVTIQYAKNIDCIAENFLVN